MESTRKNDEKLVRTVCPHGDGMACGLMAHVENGVITKIEPAEMPDPKYRHVCAKGLANMKMAYHPDRLRHPLKRVGERGEGKWQRISWDEALETVALRLREVGERYGARSVAWATGGMGELGRAYMRFAGCCGATCLSLIGFGDAAGPCADNASFGYLYGGAYHTDFEKPGLCVLWGFNPAETQIFGMRWIKDAQDRGARVVVVDPRFTVTASKADEYVPIRPGTDTALVLGMMNIILQQGLHDRSFVAEHTVGPLLVSSQTGLLLREGDVVPDGSSDRYVVWDTVSVKACAPSHPGAVPALAGTFQVGDIRCRPALDLLADMVGEYSPERVAGITGVPPDTIKRLALEHAERRPVASFRGMGLQRTFHGDLTFRAITALQAITGNINLHGPQTFVLNWRPFMRAAQRPEFMPVLKMYDAILKGDPYPIRALWAARHNPLNQDADSNMFVGKLLPNLEFIVVADLFMNATAQYADIVLPACSFLEQTDLVPSAGGPTNPPGAPGIHPYIQLQQKVIEPLHESKPDLEILTELAKKMGFAEYFDKSAEEFIELLLSTEHPSVAGITLEKLRQGAEPVRPYDVPPVRTPTGRIEFYSERLLGLCQELPVYLEPLESARTPLAEKYPLSYLNAHTKYGVHSIFAQVSWLRELEPEPVLEVNPVDAEPRGLRDGELACVFNDRGRVKLRAKVHEGIAPGVVNISEGWWPKDYIEGSHQALTHACINPAQELLYDPNAALNDVLVEVEKVQED